MKGIFARVLMSSTALLTICLAGGCATVTLVDRHLNDASKGYAEFYYIFGDADTAWSRRGYFPPIINVYQLWASGEQVTNEECKDSLARMGKKVTRVNGKKHTEYCWAGSYSHPFRDKNGWYYDSIGSSISGEEKRIRVACPPGMNKFTIAAQGFGELVVDLDVREGMVTPARSVFTRTGPSTHNSLGLSTRPYAWNIVVEDPLPIQQHEKRISEQNSGKSSKPQANVAPSAGSTVSLTAKYPINGAVFFISGSEIVNTLEVRELLARAARGLELSKESNHVEFVRRYHQERSQHPEYQLLIVTSPTIKGL